MSKLKRLAGASVAAIAASACATYEYDDYPQPSAVFASPLSFPVETTHPISARCDFKDGAVYLLIKEGGSDRVFGNYFSSSETGPKLSRSTELYNFKFRYNFLEHLIEICADAEYGIVTMGNGKNRSVPSNNPLYLPIQSFALHEGQWVPFNIR